MANGFDASLEDIGMSLNEPGGWDAFSDADDVGVSSEEIDMGMAGGGQPGPNFGGHIGSGVGYDLNQIEAELNAQALKEVEAEEEEKNKFLASIINPASYDDMIKINDPKFMRNATALMEDPKFNTGHVGSGWLQDFTENFKTLVGKEFERSKQKTVDHLVNGGMTKKEAQKAVAEDEGIVAKISGSIDDLIQTINPFKTDWAQENLYGTQTPLVDPLKSKQDFMASNKAFLSEEQEKALYGKLVGATAATKKERLSIQKQSNALEKEIEDLKEKIAIFDLQFKTFDDDETLEAYTNQIGITPLADYYNTKAVPDPKYGYFEYDNAMNQAAKQAVLEGGVPWNSDYAGPISALSGLTGPTPAGFQNQGMVEQRELANRLMAEYEGGTGINEQAAQDLQKEIDLEEISNAVAGQPIGSSPLAPAYSNAFQEKYSDFPGVTGINAVGTKFGSQWGKTPDPLWAGEKVPGPLPDSYKANMGEALKAWDSPLQSAYRPEGQLPDTTLPSNQELVLEQLKQAPPAWMNQGYPDDLPEYDVPVQKPDGGLAGMQEGVYGPPSLTESAQSAFGPPDSTEGLSPVVIDKIESNPAVKKAYVNARQAIIDQLLAKEKFTQDDWYPGSQAAAVAAGFWGPMATKANPAYRAYKDKQRAVMGLKPGQQFMSDDWITAFGGLTPDQINALVGY